MSEENTETITKSDNNLAPTFVDNHVLPDINLNGNCLINTIYITKIYIYIYICFLHTKPMVKKLKHR